MRGRLRWTILLLLLVADPLVRAAPSGNAAQTPELVTAQMRSITGYRNRYWEELLVRVKNPGPAREAWITIEQTGVHSSQQVLMRYPVRLGPQSVYQFHLPVWFDRPAPSAKKKIHIVLRVKLDDGGLVTWDHEDVFGVYKPVKDLRMMVSDSYSTSYKFIDGDDSSAEKLTRSPVAVKNLPGRLIYYEGFDILLLGGQGGTLLSAAQEEALIKWVRAGGILLYTPGPDGDVMPPGPLRDLLPVRYGVHHRVTALGFPECDALNAPDGITRYRMVRLRGHVERGRAGDPAVVQTEEGAGRILAFNFNMSNSAFQEWEGARSFLMDLMPEVPACHRYGSRLLEESKAMENLMGNLAGLSILSRRSIGIYLLVTVLLLIVPLACLRRIKRPEWGWAVMLILSLVGGIGTMLSAQFIRKQPAPLFNEVYFAGAQAGEPGIIVQAAMGLYTPVDQRFSLTTNSDQVMLRPGTSLIRPPEPFPLDFQGNLAIRDLRIHANDQRMIYGTGFCEGSDIPGFTCHLSEPGLSLDVENVAAEPIENAFVRLNRLKIPLGTIPGGSRVSRDGIRPQTAVERDGKSGSILKGAGDPIRGMLREQLMPEKIDPMSMIKNLRNLPPLDRVSEWTQPGLFFWSRQPLFPVQIEPVDISRKAVGLWHTAAHLDVKPGRVVVPIGILPMHLERKGPGVLKHPDGSFSGKISSWGILRFTLPPGMATFRLESVRTFFSLEGTGFTGELLAAPVGQPTMDLEKFTTLGGPGIYALDSLNTYFDPDTRSLTLGFKIHRQSDARASGSSAFSSRWNISLLDLELEGTVP